MRLYNRNGILYIYLNGVRKSTKLPDTPNNRKLVLSYHKNDEFINNFKIVQKTKTVLDFCEEVLDEKEKYLQHTTIATYRSLYSSRVVPFFKGKYSHEISPLMIREYYSTFKDKSTLKVCVNGILKKAFENAIIEEYIKTTPFVLSYPILKSNYEMQPFTLQEIQLILNMAKGWFRNFLGVAFFTGARTGEIVALKWSDINFDEATISISKTYTGGILKTPKTKGSIRVIDMLSQAEFYLREQRKLTGLKTHLFYNSKNELNSVPTLHNPWRKLLKECNLPYRSIYQTRHSFASNMLSNKEDVFWVSSMLGHKNSTTTLNNYSKYLKKERTRKTTFLDTQPSMLAQI